MSILDYLKIRPLERRKLVSVYSLLFKAYLNELIKKSLPIHNIDELIQIKYDGIVWNVRRTNIMLDLSMILLRHEATIKHWFVFKRDGVFVDAGAYLGSYSLRAAKSGSIVYAFEPNPQSFNILNKNANDNNLRIFLYNMALWYKEEELELTLDAGSSSIYHLEKFKPKIKIKSIPLDCLRLRHIDLMKVDVEGAEVEVLKGASSSLDVTDRIIIEVRNDTKNTVDELLRSHEFRLKGLDFTYPKSGIYNLFYEKK
jgi:FkbM family methyltransferase